MDTLNKLLIGTSFCGIITLVSGSSYIPSTGGSVPPGESPQEFSNKQQEIIYNSSAFKVTIVGASITVISLLIVWIRTLIYDCRQDMRNQREYNQPRSILKVKRSTIIPDPIEVIVEDPRPQVRTTPNLGPLAIAPNSSPPIQLVPTMGVRPNFPGPVIEKIQLHRKYTR